MLVGSRFSAQYHTVGGILDQQAQYNEFVESGLKGWALVNGQSLVMVFMMIAQR